MKKSLSGCEDCGEDNSILTQVSSGPEVIFLCSDCYNLKYSKEVQNEISHVKEKKN
jgi:ribosome-binding protein aMBF1 (putative translation factor)